MAVIVPIRGIRYAVSKIGSLADVVTPPYDVIDSAAQARYYARHPYNIIRLELGQIFAQDDERNNRYTRAANYFFRWLEEGVLEREKEPALYLYEQEFYHHGQLKKRTSFFCGVKLEPYSSGNILPHEETLSKPKADRLQLMRACKANLSPVFGLYSDPEEKVNQTLRAECSKPPAAEFIDEVGETHRLWVITDPAAQQAVIDFLAEKPIFIADGHHRYETALSYCQEMKAQGIEIYDHVLMALANIYDPGLVILPTHRVVKNLLQFDLEKFKKQLGQFFHLEAYPLPSARNEQPDAITNFFRTLARDAKSPAKFGLYTREKVFYLLVLRPDVSPAVLLDQKRSEAWRKLDVALLDHLVLDRLLGIGSEQRKNEEHLIYTRDESEALELVDKGAAQLAFFLNPPAVEEVTAVAAAGDKMPQKSTYFYPKLLTGLIINPLQDY